jgi:hypothetical protein
MRWASGLQVEFWSCDGCRQNFDRRELQEPEPARD